MMIEIPHTPRCLALPLLMLALLTGCDQADTAPPTPDSNASRNASQRQSPYRNVDGARVTRLPSIEDDAELAEAIAAARAMLDSARVLWATGPQDERNRWAVKWAAPLADGGVEHLWVRPTSWSKHRIEGVLLSRPTAELLAAHEKGDAVSLTPEDVSDWMHFTSEDGNEYEGGYTVALINERGG